MDASLPRDEDLRTSLPSGRTVSYARYGDAGGRPVVFCHGFPGSRLQGHYLDRAARARGLLVLAPDRPGIGASTDCACDAVADWVADAAGFADAMGVEGFSAVGVSGGGPYALALAASLGDRVKRAALVSSPCELDSEVLGRLGRFDATALRLARRSPRLVRFAVRHTIAGKRHNRLGWFRLRLDRGDRATIASPRVSESLSANRAQAMLGGTRALERESVAYTRPWGFDPATVSCPVDIWHGALDRLTPPFMAERLAGQLPGSRLHMVPEYGHFALLPAVVDDVLNELAAE